MGWFIKTLVDKGWVRLGLSFRWIFGTKELLTDLINEPELHTIVNRYKLMEQSGFFSDKQGASHQQAFIHALFAYDDFKGSAFSKALGFSHSWSKNSSKPFAEFLGFIRHYFFTGSTAEENKKAYIEAVCTQHKGNSNALAQAAWVENPTSQADSNPLTLLLNSVIEISGSTSENKQKVINALFIPNKNGENALYRALRSRNSNKPAHENFCVNIKVLLDALTKADCFNGPSAAANKEAFIRAILDMGDYGSVLSEAMWNTDSLQQILTALTNADCFATEQNQQAFIDALVASDCLGNSPLHLAAYNYKSLKLIDDYLKQTNCYSNTKNKQKLIDAIFAQDHNGDSALLNGSEKKECAALLLEILTHAGCFDGPTGSKNQQAFVNAALVLDRYGVACFYNSAFDPQILNQLMKIKYLEGPFAKLNQQNLIKALFTPIKIGDEPMEHAFARSSNSPTLPVIMEHLTAADCFSAESNNSNRQAFIQAVFAKDRYESNMLSLIYKSEMIILLLNKLAEAGCFNDEVTKKQFRDAVRTDGNAILFHVIRDDDKAYLVLHQCLLAAGFSGQDIKKLLNEPRTQKYDSWKVATPLMMALRGKHDLLAARLMADGAELTDSQKRQVEQHQLEVERSIKKQQKTEATIVPFNRTAIKKERVQTEKSVLDKKPKLERSTSLSNLSLFAEKKSADHPQKITRDDAFIKNVTPR